MKWLNKFGSMEVGFVSMNLVHCTFTLSLWPAIGGAFHVQPCKNKYTRKTTLSL